MTWWWMLEVRPVPLPGIAFFTDTFPETFDRDGTASHSLPPSPQPLSNRPQLLRSPSFHRGVQKVHKTVHQLQHGKPPEYYGGTHIDRMLYTMSPHFTLRTRPSPHLVPFVWKTDDSYICSTAEREAGRGVKNFFKLFWEELKTGHKPEPPTKK